MIADFAVEPPAPDAEIELVFADFRIEAAFVVLELHSQVDADVFAQFGRKGRLRQ